MIGAAMPKYLFSLWRHVEKTLRTSAKVYLFTDYDGTLTPIADSPRLAKLPPKTKRLLRMIAKHPRCRLAIVSGRSLNEVKKLVGLRRAYYMGNHGLEIEGPRFRFLHQEAERIAKVIPDVSASLKARLSPITGVLVEDKGLTLSVHFRLVGADKLTEVKSIVKDAVKAHRQLKVTRGKKVVEVRPNVDWNKGRAAELLIRSLGGGGLHLYVGDDQTDEDAFAALRDGLTILVAEQPRPSKAKYYVKDTQEVQRLLAALLKDLTRTKASPRKGR